MMRETPITQPPALLDTRAAAHYLGVAPQTMARWRVEGVGPRYAKMGLRVCYALDSLDAYIAAQTRRSTSDHPQAAA